MFYAGVSLISSFMLPFYNRIYLGIFYIMPFAYKITPTKITKFKTSPGNSQRTQDQINNEKNLTRGVFKGEMSTKTKCKVVDMLNIWFAAVKAGNKYNLTEFVQNRPYLTFATFTLSAKQQHTDQIIKRKLLNSLVIWLQRECGVKYYFWRAEPQSNGNIHFHVICDRYISNKKLQVQWNKIQETLGYVSRFAQAYGHNNPPSTHIIKVKDQKGATCYISKYVGKSTGRRVIDGRIWGCSDELRHFKGLIELEGKELQSLTDTLDKLESVRKKVDEYYTVYYVDFQKITQLFNASLYDRFRQHLEMLYDTFYMNDC